MEGDRPTAPSSSTATKGAPKFGPDVRVDDDDGDVGPPDCRENTSESEFRADDFQLGLSGAESQER